MFLFIVFILSLIAPGFCILNLLQIKIHNTPERVAFSYVISLALMLSLLTLGGIFYVFDFSTCLFLVIVILCTIYMLVFFGKQLLHHPNIWATLRARISKLTTIELAVAFSIITLFSIYVLFLSSRAILDSDVVHEYLPIARQIVNSNGFNYSNGYDYSVQLKPTGVSSLYAWTYFVSGSVLTESFRLMPIVPIIILFVLTYAIAHSVTSSKVIAMFSILLFSLLPFHDRFLMNSAFYPDLYYYPLIFATMLFLINYSKTKMSHYLFFSGMAFGIGSLLKAQTIYFVLAFMFVLVLFKLRPFKKLSALTCMFIPFSLLFVNILVTSIQRGGFILWIPSFDLSQIIILLVFSLFCGICYYTLITGAVLQDFLSYYNFLSFVKTIILLLIPLILFASLLYFVNLVTYGSLIWTSSANLPNYDWALNLLQTNTVIENSISVTSYLAYFSLIFVDPSVMGYVLLLPFLFGVFIAFRKRQESLFVLFFFTLFFSVIIISKCILSINSSASAYNPRDILPLAPLLTILSSIGLLHVTETLKKTCLDPKLSFSSFLWLSYFGFLTYVHSVYVATVSTFNTTIIGSLMSIISNSLDLNLSQTSFYLSYSTRALFVGETFMKIFALSLFVGFPFLCWRFIRRFKSGHGKFQFMTSKKFSTLRNSAFFSRFLVFLMLFSVIAFPRVELFFAQGGSETIKDTQLSTSFGALSDLITNPSILEGDILTFKAPQGLAYYLPDRKIIDLTYPANLAYLRDVFELNAPSDLVEKLNELGIKHFLLNPSVISGSLWNFSVFDVVTNPNYSEILKNYGSWTLYNIQPIAVIKTQIPLSNWSVDLTYTNASYVFESDDTLFLHLDPTTIYSRVTLVHKNLSNLNLSNYDYARIEIDGTDNAKVSVRFFFTNGNSVDFSYWDDVFVISNKFIELSSYDQTLQGAAYIGLKSSDGYPASIEIKELCFISIVE